VLYLENRPEINQSNLVHVRRMKFSPITYMWVLTIIGLIGYIFTTFDSSIFGASLPVIAKDFKISGSTISYLMAGIFAFGAISGFILGPIADRIGRKPTFQGILLATGIFSGITAFVGNLFSLAIVRIISGVGINATSPINTLISEEAPPKRRGLFMGLLQAGFPFGSALAGTLAAIFLPNWRPLFLIAFAPVLIMLISSIFLRESPHFKKVSRQRKEQGSVYSDSNVNVEKAQKSTVSQLFAKPLRRQSIVLNILNFLAPSGVVMVVTFVTLYATDVQHFSASKAALLLAINGWVALVSQVIVGYISDYIAPKLILIIGTIIAALCPILLLTANSSFSMDVLAMVIYGVFGNGVYGCIFRYTGESYPTRIRATGVFFAQADVDVMFVILPLIAGVAFSVHQPQLILYIVAIAQVLAGIVTCFGRNIKPKETLESLNNEL
jgi:MFS family permease